MAPSCSPTSRTSLKSMRSLSCGKELGGLPAATARQSEHPQHTEQTSESHDQGRPSNPGHVINSFEEQK